MTGEKRSLLPWLLVIGGTLGSLAALALTVEKIRVLEDPSYIPSCSINPILSCGSVMKSDQAEAFGFPNPLIGLVGFPIVGTLGVVLLGGVELRTWVWRSLQAGLTAGMGFVGWLMFQSLYRIGALCPYCLVVWVVMPILTIWVTTQNMAAGRLGSELVGIGQRLSKSRSIVLTIWYLTAVGLILARFWDYWRTLP